MVMVSGRRSTLNPNAPLFIPAAVRQVEDFSPEWWQLVTTSTWYHDYWISQNQGPDGFYDDGENDNDVANLLPESFDFDDMDDFFEEESIVVASEFGNKKDSEMVKKSNVNKSSSKLVSEPAKL